jgi:hypothetical protein
MQISTYLRPNVHQNGPEILEVMHHQYESKTKAITIFCNEDDNTIGKVLGT